MKTMTSRTAKAMGAAFLTEVHVKVAGSSVREDRSTKRLPRVGAMGHRTHRKKAPIMGIANSSNTL